MHRGDKLRHFGHLHALGYDIADDATRDDQDDREYPEACSGAHEGRGHGQSHTGDAIPDSALGALLPRKAAKREDEQDSRNDIGGGGETDFHLPGLLRISGTWRAFAG